MRGSKIRDTSDFLQSLHGNGRGNELFSDCITVSRPIDTQRSRRWKVAFIVSLRGLPELHFFFKKKKKSGALLFKPPPFSFVRTNYFSCRYYPPRPRVTAEKSNRFPKFPLNTPSPSKRLYPCHRFLVLFPDQGNNETKRILSLTI